MNLSGYIFLKARSDAQMASGECAEIQRGGVRFQATRVICSSAYASSFQP